MKNLANCKPSEFLRQTNKIKKAVERWLTDTDILNIRKTAPDITIVDETASEAEQEKVRAINREKARTQAKANLSRMVDAIAEEHPNETLELLALLCFVEPEHVDDYPMAEYLASIADMMANEAVISFFTSLVRLAQMGISAA